MKHRTLVTALSSPLLSGFFNERQVVMQMDQRKAEFFREYQKQVGDIPTCVFDGVMSVDIDSVLNNKPKRKKIECKVTETKVL